MPSQVFSTKFRHSLLAASTLAGLWASPGWAQATSEPVPGASPSTAGAEQGIAEIVVVAQRRSENLQDVPISITAIGADALEDRGISRLTQIDGLSANVKILPTVGYTTYAPISIRGSMTLNPSGYWEPTVGLYVDGIYVPKHLGANFNLPNIERIEVLKGPQGTLYGRNTLAGAINIITKKPTGEFSGMVEMGYGKYDDKNARFYLNTPKIGPLSFSVGGFLQARDGYYDVPGTSNPGVTLAPASDELNKVNHRALRVAARLEATENFTIDYSYDFSKSRTVGNNPKLTFIATGADNPVAIFDPNSSAYNGIPLYQYLQPGKRRRDIFVNGAIRNDPISENTETNAHSLTMALDLGGPTLKSISSYRKLYWGNAIDLDGTPVPFFGTSQDLYYKNYSQEFQISGTTGSLTYVAGLYYFKDSGHTDADLQINYPGFLFSQQATYGYGTRAYAAYAQLDWKATEQLTITGGLRYSKEKKRGDRVEQNYVGGFVDYANNSVVDGTFLVGEAYGAGLEVKDSWKAFTPTIIAKYDISDSANVYAKYARGFKSGGINGEAPDPAQFAIAFDPETVDSFEIGSKFAAFDRRLRVNFSAFWNEHKDMQLSVFDPSTGAATSSVVRNAGKARIRGLELEFQALPMDWLRISGTAGYLNTKYKQFIDGGIDVKNDRTFVYAPKFTASLSGDVRLAQGSWGELHYQIDYLHTDAFFIYPYSKTVDPNLGTNSYLNMVEQSNRVDMRVIVSDMPLGGSKADLTFWMRNVLNENKQQSTTPLGPAFGNLTVSTYTDPRTFGATLRFNF